VQRAYGKPSQAILTMPLLVGVDGHRKMSKSLGNEIGVDDPPDEMFGKTMAIPDEVMADYRRLLLEGGTAEHASGDAGAREPGGLARAGGVTGGAAGVSARDAKRALARELVSWLHSPQAAAEAEANFERMFVAHEAPEHVEEAAVSGEDGMIHLPGVIAREFGISRSEARRLIDQGGVSLGETPLAPGEHDVASARAEGKILRVGKRRFRRLRAL
jgi:tyrosyl-tRNA synthetase